MHSLIPAFFPRRHAIAANNAAAAANDAIAGTFTVIEGGAMVVPFGEREVVAVVNGRAMRVLQRIDAQAGNSMLDDLGGWLKRKLVGRPIFNGHPYHPDKAEAAKWDDKRSRGTIKEITVGNDGITLIPSYNRLGKDEVEDGQFLFHSPQWRMEPVMGANGAQEIKRGMPVFRPTSLHSAGLTNNPNLDVPALVAANEDGTLNVEQGTLNIDLPKIIEALKAAGVIKEGDDEVAILNAISGAATTLQWARDAKQREERELALLKEKCGSDAANEATREELLESLLSRLETMAANEQAADTLQAQAGAANERFTAARAARVNDAVDALVKAGRVTNANAPALRAELIDAANEKIITERVAWLSKVKPKFAIHGGPTDNLKPDAMRNVMAANEQSQRSRLRSEKFTECLAEITGGRKARPGDSDAAWNLARGRNPELFNS